MADITAELTKRDARIAAERLGDEEARFLVNHYYIMQENRIRCEHQVRHLQKTGKPNASIAFSMQESDKLEGLIKSFLDRYSRAHPVGVWMRSIRGIGPVFASCFLAYIDVNKGPDARHIWRFAGLDPTSKWEKGQKRPWCAQVKRTCFLLGESFVKAAAPAEVGDDYYRQLYRMRKDREIALNEAGAFAEQAAASLEAKRYGDDTKAKARYLEGKLPDARIHLRAERWAVKIFLSHMHEAWWFHLHGRLPKRPFILDQNKSPTLASGHRHWIEPPNQHLIEGWTEARKAAYGGEPTIADKEAL